MGSNNTGPFQAHAVALADLGYEPLPLAGKRPLYNEWQHFDPSKLSKLVDANPGANVGVSTRGLAALDCDVYDRAVAEHIRSFVIKRLKRGNAKILFRIGQAPKWLALFRREIPGPKRRSATFEDQRGQRHVIEWLADGQQFLAFGPHPETGRDMRWPNGSPLEGPTAPDDLYVVTEEDIDAVNDEFARVAGLSGWRLVSAAGEAAGQNDGAEVKPPVEGLTLQAALDALGFYENDELHYDEWLAVGMALHHQFNGSVEAFEIWNGWSNTADKAGDEHYNWHRWSTFNDSRPGGVSMRSVLMMAEANGWVRPAGVEKAPASADEFPVLDNDEEEHSMQTPAAAETTQQPEQSSDQADSPAPEPAVKDATPIDNAAFPNVFHIPADFDAAAMPPRAWVVGGVLLKGHVSITIGPPGAAKSVFDLTRAIAIVTNRALLNEPIRQSGPVMIVNNEDPKDEIERRVIAICNHHKIPLSAIANDLHIVSGYESPVKFAEMHGDRITGSSLRPTKDASRLIRHVEDNDIVAVIVDPLISTARGSEENSNDRMEELVSIYKRIAGRTGAAVSITHHTRKTGRDSEAHAGDMEAARGGGALIGAVRMAYTLARMAADTGAERGLPRAVSRRLIRLDDAKQNYWISDDEARWFYLESVDVGNGETAGVPLPVLLEDIQAEYGDTDDMDVETMTNDTKRGILVQLFIAEMEDGYLSKSLKAVADRWMSHAESSERRARDQVKRLVPEGGFDHAVKVECKGVGFWLWRETEGEGNGARNTVFICKEKPVKYDEPLDDQGYLA